MKALVKSIDGVKNELAKIDYQIQSIENHLVFSFPQKPEIHVNIPWPLATLMALMIITNAINTVLLLTR